MGLTWMRRRPCETEAVMWSEAKQCWQHQELKGLRHRFYPRAPGGSTALSALWFPPVKLTLDFWAPECERIRFRGSKLSDLWQFVTEATGKKSNWLFRTAFLGLKQRKFLLANKMAAHRMFTRAPRIRRIKKTDLSIWSEVPWCIVTSAQWNDRTLAVGFLLIIYTLGTRDCVIFTHLSIFTKTKDNLAKPLI